MSLRRLLTLAGIALALAVGILLLLILVPRTSGDDSVVIKADVVIPGSEGNTVEVLASDESSVTVSSTEGIEVGTIVVADASAGAPDGLMREVIAITEAGTGYELETQPAALTDVFEEAQFTTVINIDEFGEYELVDVSGFSASTIFVTTAQASTDLKNLFETEGEWGTFSGGMQIKLSVEIGANQIEIEQVTHARISAAITLPTSLTGPIDTLREQEVTFEIFRRPLPHFTVWAGPVPLVFTNEFQVDATLTGKATFPDPRIELVMDRKAGYRYATGEGLSSINEDNSHGPTLDFGLDDGTVGVSLEGDVTATLTSKLYGTAGAEISLGPKLELSSTLRPAAEHVIDAIELPGIDRRFEGRALFQITLPIEGTFVLTEPFNIFDGEDSTPLIDAKIFASDDLITLYKYEKTVGDIFDLNELDGRTFQFSSGAGGWWTETEFGSDGTFTGTYVDHDSDGSVSATFDGQFSVASRIDEHTYELTLEDLTITSPTGTVEPREGGGTVRWVDYAYGFDGGDTFMLYLPGKPISDLPEDFIGWSEIRYHSSFDTMTGLPHHGIFDTEALYGMDETTSY